VTYLALILAIPLAFAQVNPQAPQEPPEEDEASRVKEYSFNPLQATKEFNVGNFSAKRGNWKGAALRYEEATKWNPGFGDAYLKWAEALLKLNEPAKAKEVWAKFLEVAPDHKKAAEIRKKVGGAAKPKS